MAKKQAAQEAAPEARPPRAARILSALARYRPLLMVGLVVGFFAGAVALWRAYGDQITARNAAQYRVTLEGLQTSEQPAWIKSSVRDEVFADAGWDKQPLSILEPDVTVRVARAFEQHTWVARVVRVTKGRPARMDVEVQYRRPIAMVEVEFQGQNGLLPVDGEGILLPPED
ncbi:MAG: hypothetical protein KDA41_12310, partial [Planctomycetales bacterium]|nr:hypothetical protein [Planctomycetales bacterium]